MATVTAKVVECDCEGLVPVTVTMYDPTLPEHVRVDVAGLSNVTEFGLREHDSPDEGDICNPRFTVPVKP